jgi:hypothetical protein
MKGFCQLFDLVSLEACYMRDQYSFVFLVVRCVIKEVTRATKEAQRTQRIFKVPLRIHQLLSKDDSVIELQIWRPNNLYTSLRQISHPRRVRNDKLAA